MDWIYIPILTFIISATLLYMTFIFINIYNQYMNRKYYIMSNKIVKKYIDDRLQEYRDILSNRRENTVSVILNSFFISMFMVEVTNKLYNRNYYYMKNSTNSLILSDEMKRDYLNIISYYIYKFETSGYNDINEMRRHIVMLKDYNNTDSIRSFLLQLENIHQICTMIQIRS